MLEALWQEADVKWLASLAGSLIYTRGAVGDGYYLSFLASAYNLRDESKLLWTLHFHYVLYFKIIWYPFLLSFASFYTVFFSLLATCVSSPSTLFFRLLLLHFPAFPSLSLLYFLFKPLSLLLFPLLPPSISNRSAYNLIYLSLPLLNYLFVSSSCSFISGFFSMPPFSPSFLLFLFISICFFSLHASRPLLFIYLSV